MGTDPNDFTSRRYQDLGLIGKGSMGEIRRVRDLSLGRTVAMKVIRAEHLGNRGLMDRFIEEAQATAQLQHPSIVPIHEIGRLSAGVVYFTMKEVHGQTLTNLIETVHMDAERPARESIPGDERWTLRRLIDAFNRACEAAAYAHSRGVLHRDLKPDNVMIGDYGEVLVLDWGLAKIMDQADSLLPIVTRRTQDASTATRIGRVAGTPAYMPPEQARGATNLGPRADVYALGAILYEILSGRPPYRGRAQDVLERLQHEDPAPLGPAAASGLPLPEALRKICARAMARDPDARYPDASALAFDLRAWLDGARKRDEALALVDQARTLLPEIRALRAQAQAMRAEARQRLHEIPPWAEPELKRAAWAVQATAKQQEREAELKVLEYTQLLRSALSQAPDLLDARALLSDHYRERHAQAEAAGNDEATAVLEILLRDHDTGRYAAYLEGVGALTLHTEPSGAHVRLFRYIERDRKLELQECAPLGTTPLNAVEIPIGSYMLQIEAPGRAPVRYPVLIRRQEHWMIRPPDASRSQPLYLPTSAELGGDLYVPAGWFLAGGDPLSAREGRTRRVWVDGFAIKPFPVTNAQYVAFLEDLYASGRRTESLAYAPRERGAAVTDAGGLIFGRDRTGRFVLRKGVDARQWQPHYPVTLIDWFGAHAYARWMTVRTELPWRLPVELEWEKAARGVDGRRYPWGGHLDPSFCAMAHSHDGRPMPKPVQSHPVDESPYGVRGAAGNVRDWCQEYHEVDAPGGDRAEIYDITADADTPISVRGGSWSSRDLLLARRRWHPASYRSDLIGFRLVRSLERRRR